MTSKRQAKADRMREAHPEDFKLSNKEIIIKHGTKPAGPKK